MSFATPSTRFCLSVLRESDRHPIAKAGIQIVAGALAVPGALVSAGRTSSEGTFDSRLVAGTYGVIVDGWYRTEINVPPALRYDFTILYPEPTTNGIVLDSTGIPVPNAQVWCSGYGNKTLTRQLTLTDNNGRFGVNVPPGHYLGARERDHVSGDVVRTQEGDREYELHLLSGTPGRVEGLVSDEAGRPLSGATVTFIPPYPSGTHDAKRIRRTPALRIETDSAGKFVLEGIDPGHVSFKAEFAGYMTVTTSGVAVLAGETSFLAIGLGRGYSIAGVVRCADNASPVPGAHVSVIDGEGARLGMTRSNSTGEFYLRGIPAGAVRLTGESEELVGQIELTVGGPPGERSNVILSLNQLPSLRGRLIRPNGEGVPGWLVTFRAEGGGGLRVKDTTDSEGGFVLRKCRWERGQLDVLVPGGRHDLLVLRKVMSLTSDDVQIVISDLDWPTQTIRGEAVIDASGDMPHSGYVVFRDSVTGGEHHCSIDSRDGSFIMGPIPRHGGTILIIAQNACRHEIPVDWREDETQLNLGRVLLQGTGTVRVSVSGDLLAIESCRLRAMNGKYGRLTTLDQNGECAFDGVPPGDYRLLLEGGRGRKIAEDHISVVGGEIAEHRLRVE